MRAVSSPSLVCPQTRAAADQLTVPSENSRRLPAEPLRYCRGLWRERSNLAKDCRCGPKGIRCLRRQPGMHQVCKAVGSQLYSDSPYSNLTFGAGGKDSAGNVKSGWGYYETIAGGSGAGPGWHGTSGVHTHITNTRIGDPEILERRYPVLLHRFEIRDGSGGKGEFSGGDGVVREFEFLQNLQVSMLSEVSVYQWECLPS